MKKGKERILEARGAFSGKAGKGKARTVLEVMCLCWLLLAPVWILSTGNNKVKAADLNTETVYTSGDYQYKLRTDGTAEITGYIGAGVEITVPARLDGKVVSKIGDDAFIENEKITKVVIENGIKELGRACFYDCKELLSVYIPDSVESIGTSLLSGTIKLVDVHLPKNIITIPEDTFNWCTSLKKIEIPDKVQKIATGAFSNCLSLGEIYLPDSATYIGSLAFCGCKKLERIRISPRTYAIRFWAFADTENLKWVTSVDYRFLKIKDYSSVTSILSEGPWILVEEEAFDNSLHYCTVVVGKNNNIIEQKAFGANTILCGKVGTNVQEYAKNNSLTFKEYIPVKQINLNKKSVSLQWNESNVMQLVPSVVPSIATITQVGYRSSNPSVAMVDGAGKVTALKEGSATITAVSLDDPSIIATCQVVVTTAVKKMTLSKTSLKLAPGKENRVQLKVTLSPSNSNNYKVLWKSSNTKIATVNDKGVVTGIKPGKVNITATCKEKTVTCTVIVLPSNLKSFTMKGQTISSITLKWKPVSGVTGYTLYRYDTKKKKYVGFCNIKGSNSTYTLKQINKQKLTSGTSYTIFLRPYKQIGKTKYYGKGLSLKVATKPATVQITSVKRTKATGKQGWKVYWKKVKGASGYRVYISTNGGKKYGKVTTINKPTQLSYQYKKGKKARYYIKIRAYKKVGSKVIEGAFSKAISIRIY